MTEEITDVPNWLDQYFSSQTEVNKSEVYKSGKLNIESYVSLINSACNRTYPIFLPCDDNHTFFALALSARELIELRLVLRSFLGSVYIQQSILILKHSDSQSENILLDKFPEGIIKFSLLDKYKFDLDKQRLIHDALLSVIRLYANRPSIKLKTPRPIGRILRDFFTACNVDDGVSAFEFFNEIKNSGVISQRNLFSLEVQALAASQKWEEILDYGQLGPLIAGRVSNRIYSLILLALGGSCLNQVLVEGVYTQETYDNVKQVTGSLCLLFLKPPSYGDNKAFIDDWKRWAICASVHGFSDLDRFIPASVDAVWVSQLKTWAGLPQVISSKKTTVNISQTLSSLNDVTELLMKSVTADSDEIEKIFNALNDMSDSLQQELSKLPRLNMIWGMLKEEYFSGQRGWINWFTDLIEAKKIDILENELVSNFENWNANTFDQKKIYALLQKGLSEERSIILRNALPVLLSWLDKHDVVIDNVDFWIIYLEIFSLDDSASVQDMSLAGQLSSRILLQTLSKDQYASLLEAIDILWTKSGSINRFDSLLEIYEILFESVRPSPNLLSSFWNDTIQKFALVNWTRLNITQQYLTKSLAEEMLGTGILSIFPSVEIDDDIPPVNTITDFNGVILGIYTLTETSAYRAKSILETMFKGLKVELNHDHASTEGLKNLARKAKYFIFSTSSAKHQAFYSVSSIRNDLIYPKGKGASSLINAFIEHINI